MVSIGFDAVAGLNVLSFALKGVAPGKVHRITRAATVRSDLYMLQDVPGGLFVVLDEAPLGSLLPTEHVLLVAVQHVTGMWVIRGMRMKAYFAATKAEAADAAKFGSLGAALTDAQHLAVGSPVGCIAVAKPKRKTAVETTIFLWAREMEQRYMATGKLWVMQANGTRGIGMPQQQYVMGGDFATALSTVAAAKLVEVRRELREVGEEIALVTPVNRNVPLAAQQLIRESGAAVLLGGSSTDATSPAVLPLLRTMGFSPFMPGAGAPALVWGVRQFTSPPTSVVSLSALAAGLSPNAAARRGPVAC